MTKELLFNSVRVYEDDDKVIRMTHECLKHNEELISKHYKFEPSGKPNCEACDLNSTINPDSPCTQVPCLSGSPSNILEQPGVWKLVEVQSMKLEGIVRSSLIRT